MTYQNDNTANAIMQIQGFLRTIEISEGDAVTVPIDGIFDSVTKEAVQNFQRENGLTVTGTVDKTTYDLLYQKSLEAEFEMSEPLPVYIFSKGRTVRKGERSSFVVLLQMMLNELKIAYDDYDFLEEDGVFGELTENAIKNFQSKNRLLKSGIVDKKTWNALVENYNKYRVMDT